MKLTQKGLHSGFTQNWGSMLYPINFHIRFWSTTSAFSFSEPFCFHYFGCRHQILSIDIYYLSQFHHVIFKTSDFVGKERRLSRKQRLPQQNSHALQFTKTLGDKSYHLSISIASQYDCKNITVVSVDARYPFDTSIRCLVGI